MACRHLKLFNLSGDSLLGQERSQETEGEDTQQLVEVPSDLNSFGLACRTNRTVQFAAMDLR